MTKWHGTVVHLRVEKLQPRGHVHWRYRVAAAVSQSREFRPKIENEFYEFFLNFFLIFFQLGWDRKFFEIEKNLNLSTQNLLKRIANHFKNKNH